jgi:D-methionine transport system substrate-binding protein
LLIAAAFALSPLFSLAAARADEAIRVAIMSAEDEDVWAAVSQEAKKHGLTVRLIVFNDYTQPNEALENGELDANAFQHKPYLDNQIKTRGYHIVPVGFTAVWPIGLYSKKHHSLANLPSGAVVGVPNDPSNEDRALRVLEAQGLIKLKPEAGILATTQDITDNPKNLVVKELDAGIVGRSIDDLDAAAIVNTDWALKSGLTQSDRIATEAVENNFYRNFIAVKAGHENDAWVKALVESYENDTVCATLAKVYKGTARPAW